MGGHAHGSDTRPDRLDSPGEIRKLAANDQGQATMKLARFSRARLAHPPTPPEPLTRLSAHLDGPEIRIRRDDCTGLSMGGNKTCTLELLMAKAQAQGADLESPQWHAHMQVKPAAPCAATVKPSERIMR